MASTAAYNYSESNTNTISIVVTPHKLLDIIFCKGVPTQARKI